MVSQTGDLEPPLSDAESSRRETRPLEKNILPVDNGAPLVRRCLCCVAVAEFSTGEPPFPSSTVSQSLLQ